MYYALVGKPSLATLSSTQMTPNIVTSPNGNPQGDFVVLTLAHEVSCFDSSLYKVQTVLTFHIL